jgi:hypothetical protein
MFEEYKKRQNNLELQDHGLLKCSAALDLGAAGYSETLLCIWIVIWGWNGILRIFLFHPKLHDMASQKACYLHTCCCEYLRSHIIYLVFTDKLYTAQTALSCLRIMRSSGKNLWHLLSFLWGYQELQMNYTIQWSISAILICTITVTTIIY